MNTSKDDIEAYEIQLLIEAMEKVYGINFKDYRYAYLERRIKRRMSLSGFDTITGLTNEVIKRTDIGKQLFRDLTINVTEMFRCPGFFKYLRQEIIPILKTYPSIRIWHAGCSTGEEVISLAILLKETGLYDRSTIIASDINEESISRAKYHVYPIDKIKDWTENYYMAGGKNPFSDYYVVKYNHAKFENNLFDNVEFIRHNLIKDAYPKDIHLILCRNVFIYFDTALQIMCTKGFYKSLIDGGFLGIGIREKLRNIDGIEFKVVDNNFNIYKKE